MIQPDKNIDNRKFFRIDDEVILQYKLISKDVDSNNLPTHSSVDKITFKAKFDAMTREIKPLHHKVIDSCSPDVAMYLSAMDKKLNLLSEYIIKSETSEMDMTPQPVNIGAGGMSLTTSTPFMSGSILELKFILLPENTVISTYARVVSCSRNDESSNQANSSYIVATEFQHMCEDVRDLITKHVLSREQASIRN